VLDDETSRPLGDVEVRIRNHVDWETHVFRTDALGRLRFEYPSPLGGPAGDLEVRKDGYVPVGFNWGIDGGPRMPDTLTIRLRRGMTMGGIVVAESGRPVEGVTVLMTVTGYGPGRRVPNATGDESYYQVPSRTGPDGRWRTDRVPPGADAATLRLIHPDFVCDGYPTREWPVRSPKIEGLRDQTDRQVLLAGVVVKGRVVDEQGRPLAGARIDATTRGYEFYDFDVCRPTDPEGRLEIHLGRGQKVHLMVTSKGYAPATRELTAEPGQSSVEFRLAPGRRLRGRVVDPDGHPIGAAGDNEAVITLRPAVEVCLDAIDARTGEAIPRFRVELGRRQPDTNAYRWSPRMGRSPPRKFEATLAAEEGPYHFRISADGYAPERILVPSARTYLRKTIKLERLPNPPAARP
jgi:hypothetical protein